MNKRILIAVDSLHSGGAEMFAIRLANFLSKNHIVFFLEFNSLASKDKHLVAMLNSSITYFSPSNNWVIKSILWLNQITKFKWYRFFGKLSNSYRYVVMKSLVKRHQIENINSHAIFQNVVFSKIKKAFPKIKFVVTLHGHYEYYKIEDPAGVGYFVKDVVINCDNIVYTSKEQLDTFLRAGLNPAKATRIFYGFEVPKDYLEEPINALGSMSFNVLIHSRAIVEKGWEQAIEAIILLHNKGLNVQLTLVGGGELLKDLQSRHLPSYIVIIGFTDNVMPFIKNCDLGLLPSYFHGESLPNTIIEYLYFSKPVVASNIGAIADMLAVDGHFAGELLNVEKGLPADVIVLAQTIEKFIINKDFYLQKSRLAKKAFAKFEMESCANAYLSLFN